MRQRSFFALFLLAVATFGTAQKKTHDVMTFTPPTGWAEEQSSDGVSYKTTDAKKKTFCVLIVQNSLASTGDRKKDFAAAWKKFVMEPFGVANAKPDLEDQKIGANPVLSGAELIKTDDIEALAILSTMTLKGRVVPVLSLMNEANYAERVEKFIATITVDVTKKPVATKPKLTEKTAPAGSTTYSGSGAVSDYEFTAPQGWVATKTPTEITLKHEQSGRTSVLSVLPMIKATGTAEETARALFWDVFKGWKPYSSVSLGFKEDYGTFERGKTAQGFDYFQYNRYAEKIGNPELRNDMSICVIKVGENAVILAGAQQFQSIDEPVHRCIDFLLYSFQVKGVAAKDHQKSLIGSWSAVGGGVGLSYTYFPNNTFAFGGASQFRTSKTETTDLVTTTSFSSDGTFTLTGNILTTNNKKSGNVSKARIRFFERKYDKDDWQPKLGKLDLTEVDGSGIITFSRDK